MLSGFISSDHARRAGKGKSMMHVAVSVVLAGLLTFSALGDGRKRENTIGISVLSTRPDRISGGDALMRISASRHQEIRAELNGNGVTGSFSRGRGSKYWVGLVTGL